MAPWTTGHTHINMWLNTGRFKNISTYYEDGFLAGKFTITPWLVESEGSMPHSQGLCNNPYTEPNQPNSAY